MLETAAVRGLTQQWKQTWKLAKPNISALPEWPEQDGCFAELMSAREGGRWMLGEEILEQGCDSSPRLLSHQVSPSGLRHNGSPLPTGPSIGELWTRTGATPQHHLFPGKSCSFPYASRQQCLRQGWKQAASCLEIPEIIKKAGSVLTPQDKVWPLHCLLSAFLFGRREFLLRSSTGCLNAHGMSTEIGPEEKTWTGEQAPTIAGNCRSPCPNPAEPLQKHAGSGEHPWCRSKRSTAFWDSLLRETAWECQGHVYVTFPQHLLCAHPEGEWEHKSQGQGVECMTKEWKSGENEEGFWVIIVKHPWAVAASSSAWEPLTSRTASCRPYWPFRLFL